MCRVIVGGAFQAVRWTADGVEPLESLAGGTVAEAFAVVMELVRRELLSPLAWDLGHIANFEELWLVQRAGGHEPLDGELGRLYDAIENPRASRNWPILPPISGFQALAGSAKSLKSVIRTPSTCSPGTNNE